MKRTFVLILAILALATTMSAATTDVNGKWKIIWPAPGKPNMVTLAVDKNRFIDGVYSSDDGEQCPVKGMLIFDDGVYLAIACGKFTITMDGKFSPDNDQEITGTYTSGQFPSGKFTMEKQVCLLPEGCK